MRLEHHDGGPAVSLARTFHGPDWVITVPADGKSHRRELARAKREALRIWKELEYEFYRPAEPANRGNGQPAKPRR
jgi:hypothetical protein